MLQLGGKVLEGVHGEVDAALKQGEVQLPREESLPSDPGEQAVLIAIARGTDHLHAHGQTRRFQVGLHHPALGDRQPRPAGSKDQIWIHAGLGRLNGGSHSSNDPIGSAAAITYAATEGIQPVTPSSAKNPTA